MWWNEKTVIVSDLVNIVSADGLAPVGARPSAATVLS